jgi:hypothetical protein
MRLRLTIALGHGTITVLWGYTVPGGPGKPCCLRNARFQLLE